MPESRKKPDLVELIRLPILIPLTVAYNTIAVFAVFHFWDYNNGAKIAFCSISYLILATLLALRCSRRVQRWMLKPDYGPQDLVPLLRFPLILWLILPTVALFLPL